MEQTVKTLRDGISVPVKKNADTWEDAYQAIVDEFVESIASDQFFYEKVVIFDENGGVARTFEPQFFSKGVIDEEED